MSANWSPPPRSGRRLESRPPYKEAARIHIAPAGLLAAPVDLVGSNRSTTSWFDPDSTASDTAVSRHNEPYKYHYSALRGPPTPPNSDLVSPLTPTPAPLSLPSSAGAESEASGDSVKRAVSPVNQVDSFVPQIRAPRPRPSQVKAMQAFGTTDIGPPPSQPQPQLQTSPRAHHRKDSSKWKELPARPTEEEDDDDEGAESAAYVAPIRKTKATTTVKEQAEATAHPARPRKASSAKASSSSPERRADRKHTAGSTRGAVLYINQLARRNKDPALLPLESSANMPRPDSSTIGTVEKIRQVQLSKQQQQQAEKTSSDMKLAAARINTSSPSPLSQPHHPQPEACSTQPLRHAGGPKLTSAQRFWLHRHYRGEVPFLKGWGLSISSEEDRAEGLVILRELMDMDVKDKKARARRDHHGGSHREEQHQHHATVAASEAEEEKEEEEREEKDVRRSADRSPIDALRGAIEKALQVEGGTGILVGNYRIDSGGSSVTEEFIRSPTLTFTHTLG